MQEVKIWNITLIKEHEARFRLHCLAGLYVLLLFQLDLLKLAVSLWQHESDQTFRMRLLESALMLAKKSCTWTVRWAGNKNPVQLSFVTMKVNVVPLNVLLS